MIHLGPDFREEVSDVGTTTGSITPAQAAQELLDRVCAGWHPIHKNMMNEMYFL
jgi:hypothetical protein